MLNRDIIEGLGFSKKSLNNKYFLSSEFNKKIGHLICTIRTTESNLQNDNHDGHMGIATKIWFKDPIDSCLDPERGYLRYWGFIKNEDELVMILDMLGITWRD